MLKNILRLLAASTSFVALLLVTNSAIAITPLVNTSDQFQATSINLNVVSPSLQLASSTDSLLDHFGCSCGACTQSLGTSNSL